MSFARGGNISIFSRKGRQHSSLPPLKNCLSVYQQNPAELSAAVGVCAAYPTIGRFAGYFI
ncbi:MAG TPA: hypothetical protein IAD32_07440 [Candidatus Scatavimonas merdigallinarum]|uniref:Uncharacterized protein n=1 Tax=Candidatus Scatavimonas merdigallinarum TaxID=2840914 RepID=A0A9D1CUN3_9FIRM|nr:hypothetical protein [Candidatus Scatavimonas merdigallinarum]